MRRIKHLAKLALAGSGFLAYVWFAAVRYAPRVKRRKRRRPPAGAQT
ncbi:MAG: hypothetical protein ACYDA3_06360 [Gaiellaceae bacterium]